MRRKQAIIVLGMHRSGTSVAMALAEMQGVVLGDRLFGAREDNPKGFFEHADVIHLNEKIFNVFGLHSQDVVPLPAGFENNPEVVRIKKQLIEILKRDFAKAEILGIKDPRMCLLMPVWHQIFEEIEVEPIFIVPYRHPLEVANSLNKRDGISVPQGLLLWLRYMLEIMVETKNHTRHFIEFDALLNNPEEFFRGLNLPKPFPKAEADAFIAKSLRHHQTPANTDAMPWVMELFQMLPNVNEKRALEIHQDLLAILTPAAEMAIAKGKAEHYLRAELAKKRKWFSWQA
jgi:hypothetical protein